MDCTFNILVRDLFVVVSDCGLRMRVQKRCFVGLQRDAVKELCSSNDTYEDCLPEVALEYPNTPFLSVFANDKGRIRAVPGVIKAIQGFVFDRLAVLALQPQPPEKGVMFIELFFSYKRYSEMSVSCWFYSICPSRFMYLMTTTQTAARMVNNLKGGRRH